jgi:hypothetical protein
MAEAKKSPIVELYESLRGKSQEPDKLAEAYFLTFSSPHGQAVLAHLLVQLHVFDEVQSDEEMVLSNFGKRLLGYIGIICEDNVKDIVKMYVFMVKKKIEAGLEIEHSKSKED